MSLVVAVLVQLTTLAHLFQDVNVGRFGGTSQEQRLHPLRIALSNCICKSCPLFLSLLLSLVCVHEYISYGRIGLYFVMTF